MYSTNVQSLRLRIYRQMLFGPKGKSWMDGNQSARSNTGRAEITLDAYKDVTINGKVFQILEEGKNVSNVITYYVKIRPEKTPEFFKSLMTANIDIIVKEQKDAAVIPWDSFVEDDGWHEASANYAYFLRKHETGHVLYLELGVGSNTPVIIKFPFWVMTYDNPEAVYACLNYNESFAPKQIATQSICLNGDIGEVLDAHINNTERV